MALSKDQMLAFKTVMASVDNKDKKRYFLNGNAGNGKSFLVRTIIDTLGSHLVAKLAPTGLAAQLIGGVTIHKFFGIHPSNPYVKTKGLERRMTMKKLVVIDEISMVDNNIFTMIMEALSSYNVPVLFIGDFLQLRPVEYDYCFTSPMWCNVETLELTTNHRQKDESFINVLEDIRYGNNSKELNKFIAERKITPPKDILKLSPYRAEVVRINNKKLKELGEKIYKSMANVVFNNSYVEDEKMFKNSRVPEEIRFSIGAKIIMLTNDPQERWCNGTMAHVKSIVDRNTITIDIGGFVHYVKKEGHSVFDAEGKEIFQYEQLPFQLGYAITVHKSQGCSLDEVFIDLDNHFAEGMSYVSFSRCTKPDGIYLKGDLELMKPNKKALNFVTSLVAKNV